MEKTSFFAAFKLKEKYKTRESRITLKMRAKLIIIITCKFISRRSTKYAREIIIMMRNGKLSKMRSTATVAKASSKSTPSFLSRKYALKGSPPALATGVILLKNIPMMIPFREFRNCMGWKGLTKIFHRSAHKSRAQP